MYHEVLTGFVQNGRAPHYVELAHALDLSPEQARQTLHVLVGLGGANWLVPDTDIISSFAPFSNVPSPYLISVDGEQRWYAQCGLESLAVSWLFPGREVRIDAPCLDCGDSVSIRMKDGELLDIDPPSMVGYTKLPVWRWRDNHGYA